MATGDDTYTPEMAELICAKLASGMSLRAVCRSDPNIPPKSTILDWVKDNVNGFAVHYARAREIGYHDLGEDLLEISDDGRNDWMQTNDPDNPGYRLNGEHVQRSRLRVDTRKWILSKMLPKVYGERQNDSPSEITIKIEGGLPE